MPTVPAAPDDSILLRLGFLRHLGVEPADIVIAWQLAQQWQVSTVEAILTLGLVPEQAFYQALARELEIPYLPDDIPIAGPAPYPAALTAQALPLAPNSHDLRIVIAPGGAMVEMLLCHRERFSRNGVALVSPARLSELAHHRLRREIAHHAATDLAERNPEFSYLGGITKQQAAVLSGLVCAGITATLMAPQIALAFFMLVAGALFLAMSALRIACLSWYRRPRKPQAPPLSDADLPVYSVIVPLYREARIIPQLLHALASLDYPPAKLDIMLVLEADDPLTPSAIAACQPAANIRIVTMPPGQPRTKPRALNAAFARARGSHVVIYDAEDIPDPQQLRRAAELFAVRPDIACLQARIVIDNVTDGVIATMFAIEYAALFDAINPGLANKGLPLLLGGTSNHIRADVLIDIGGWDAWNVTEDADLGIRLARHGYQVMDLPSVTREEAPFGVSAWLGQRARWLKGWMQVCITHSRNPRQTWRDLGPIGFFTATILTVGTLIGALFMPLFVSVSGWMAITTYGTTLPWHQALVRDFSLVVMICGALAFLLPAIVGLARRRRLWLLYCLPLTPLYFLMLTIAAWLGLLGLIREPSYWCKTGHGLSTRRRSVRFTTH